MSVPNYDVKMLWQLSPDAFNEWRSKNDLPILFSYFKEKLPGFQTWLNEFGIDMDTFCRVIPIGHLFVGQGCRLLIQNREDQLSHWSFSVSECAKETLLQRYKSLGEPLPEIKTFIPYFIWAKNTLKDDRFITSDPANKGRTDTFVYNSWSGFGPRSRASLFQTFQVLKLGGITLRGRIRIGGRNLDFVDLDDLTVEDALSCSQRAYIHFSSCRNMTFQNTQLAFLYFIECNTDDISFTDCKLQDIYFEKSILIDANFVQSRLNRVVFDRCDLSVNFDKCELSEMKYYPKKGLPISAIQMYRRLRTAYQNIGKRREASSCYYLERKSERKALFSPLLYFSAEFPRVPYPISPIAMIKLWKQGHLTKTEAIKQSLKSVFFHVRVWLKYKTKYVLSLIDELAWGYGEKPIRILLTSLLVLSIYTIAYYRLFSPQDTSQSYSLVDCLYFSIVTFTTLGYGDITPKTDFQKIICGSEALIGAFLIGLIVAGFANKSKY